MLRHLFFICDFGSLITHKELENADGIYESVAGYVRGAVDTINTNKSKKRKRSGRCSYKSFWFN